MQRLTTHEAKTHLSKILGRVERGEEFLICRGDLPIARLTAVDAGPAPKRRPPVGTLTSEPVSWTSDAFSQLSPEELADWGL